MPERETCTAPGCKASARTGFSVCIFHGERPFEERPDARRPWCGSCTAGILVGINGDEIERCDDCELFATDADAVLALQDLAAILHRVYLRSRDPGPFTPADALQLLDNLATHHLLTRRQEGA